MYEGEEGGLVTENATIGEDGLRAAFGLKIPGGFWRNLKLWGGCADFRISFFSLLLRTSQLYVCRRRGTEHFSLLFIFSIL